MKKANEQIPIEAEHICWSLLEAREEALVLINMEGTILLANQTAAHLHSRSSEEMASACLWDLLPTARANYLKILVNQAIHNEEPITAKQQEDGQWNRVMVYPLKDDKERVAQVAVCTWNISPMVDAQEKYKRIALALINAQEEERHRISRDLHDDIGQRMTALALNLHAMESTLKNDKKISVIEVRNAIRDLEMITKQTRQIFYQLHPPSLSTVPFPKMLEAFCASIEYSSEIEIDYNCQEDIPDLSNLQTTVLYRFVQEGFSNIIKHAEASRAWINFDCSDGDFSISIEDDGKGFVPDQTNEGLGLRGLRERFQIMEGSIEIESGPGKGTRLFCSLPVLNKEN